MCARVHVHVHLLCRAVFVNVCGFYSMWFIYFCMHVHVSSDFILSEGLLGLPVLSSSLDVGGEGGHAWVQLKDGHALFWESFNCL